MVVNFFFPRSVVMYQLTWSPSEPSVFWGKIMISSMRSRYDSQVQWEVYESCESQGGGHYWLCEFQSFMGNISYMILRYGEWALWVVWDLRGLGLSTVWVSKLCCQYQLYESQGRWLDNIYLVNLKVSRHYRSSEFQAGLYRYSLKFQGVWVSVALL